MRTTLDLDDGLLKDANKRAIEEGETLTRLIERALRHYLHPAAGRRPRYRLHLLTKQGTRIPGVNVDDRDALYERMEGRG